MKATSPPTYSLEQFEGSLDLLWQLVHNEEISVLDFDIKELIHQFLAFTSSGKKLDEGSDFIHFSTALLFEKSKALLPAYETQEEEPPDPDPHFNVIHNLVEYCRFKQAARGLVELESQQPGYFFRGNVTGDTTRPKPLGVEHLSLADLAALFKQIASKATSSTRIIHEEVWKVSDKITLISRKIKEEREISFFELFAPHLSKEELIVIFLAVLEMMKNGAIVVLKLPENEHIVIRESDD